VPNTEIALIVTPMSSRSSVPSVSLMNWRSFSVSSSSS